ncbi:hypothetical protein DER29_6123 [Micromonospora sp. M71_S20]|uniref:hypothetical protein n=1 Tax=Micromonospora sp. M71_S20 TaxID=592872 RepID=UPI000F292074|nr:hypothetical protein [Micromonospora sp. M71_S20]RLK09588.1 hypothetical protein DER29_6123 [Micromonospora sp. M71_S20]
MFKITPFRAAAVAGVLGSVLLSSAASASTLIDPPGDRGINNVLGTAIPPQAAAENDVSIERQFSIEIENVAGGAITHVAESGVRTRMGGVERAATTTVAANDGFWASKYSRAVDGSLSHVLATSVYVLRLRVGPDQAYDPLNQRAFTARLVNLRPDQFLEADQGNWQADTIYTDIPGGIKIFGGATAPPVGSPVTWWDTARSQWRPLAEHFAANPNAAVPAKIRYTVYKPVSAYGTPGYLELENWSAGDTVGGRTNPANGRVLVAYPGGVVRHVADVLQRVRGSGRFGGTEFAAVGQIDTNHPGALTLSTSPRVGYTTDFDQRGGLQIVPANHAKYLGYVLGQEPFIGRAQWMVVGPVGATSAQLADERYLIDGQLSVNPGWEAVAPLFGMYVRTSYNKDWLAGSTRFVVSYDYGATWQQSPSLTGTTEPPTSPVNNWTNIRVYLQYPTGP